VIERVLLLRRTPLSLLLVLTGAVGALLACAQVSGESGPELAPPASARGAARAVQIIVKFRDPRLDPSRAQFLGEMGRDIGARLVYVRPMSGGAHVLRLEALPDGAELDRIVGRLARRPDVEYAEPDRRMRPMRGDTK